MATEIATSTISPALERRIAEHRIEAERLRAELGDPAEALAAWVRDNLDRDALLFAFEEQLAGRGLRDEAETGDGDG